MNATAPSRRTHPRMKIVRAAISCSLLILVASHAEATVSGSLAVGQSGWPPAAVWPDPSKSESGVFADPEYGTKTLTNPLAVASIEGNTRAGSLRASAVSVYVSEVPTYYSFSGKAVAEIGLVERLTFENVQPGQVGLIDSVVGGHFTQDPQALIDGFNPGIAKAFHKVGVFDTAHPATNVYITEGFIPSALSCENAFGAAFDGDCFIGDSASVARSLPFSLSNGTFSFDWRLTVEAAGGASAEFGNTALVYLRLPEGVTFTSESGGFLAEAVPLVPEPSTSLLQLTGFGGLALLKRRRGAATAAGVERAAQQRL